MVCCSDLLPGLHIPTPQNELRDFKFSIPEPWFHPWFWLVHCREVNVTLPLSTLKNGSLYAHVFLGPKGKSPLRHKDLKHMATVTTPLTKYSLPQTSAFNLITGSYEVCQCMDDTVHIVGGYSAYVGCSHQYIFSCLYMINLMLHPKGHGSVLVWDAGNGIFFNFLVCSSGQFYYNWGSSYDPLDPLVDYS